MEVINKEEIAIVLTDINMPEMNGNNLLASIRNSKPTISALLVIMMSGDIQTAVKQSFSKAGFNGIVSKPILEAELIEQIVTV